MLIWDGNVRVDIKSMNKNIINAYISYQQNKVWLTCLYGHLEVQSKNQVWSQLIENAKSVQSEDEWLVIGDFNQPLSNKDKLSFKSTKLRGAQNLQDYLD